MNDFFKQHKIFVYFLIFAFGLILGRISFEFGTQLPVTYRHSYGDKILKLIHLINQRYVDKINTDTLVSQVMNQILSDLDPHSYYFTKSQYLLQRQDITGKFKGLGIYFSSALDTPVVLRVYSHSPAAAIGMIPGDQILEINRKKVVGLNPDSVSLIIKNSGDRLYLVLRRPSADSIWDTEVEKRQLNIKTVFCYKTPQNFLYFKITEFGDNTADEFYSCLARYDLDSISGVILDLRDNPGGVLTSSLSILSAFFPKGVMLCYLKGHLGIKQKCFNPKDGVLRHVRLAVLVNSATASASEIIAGVVQDYDRGVIIGTRTFGKGLVQSEYSFGDGSVVRLTTARYYTPSGRCLQKPYSDYVGEYLYVPDTVVLDSSKKFQTKHGRTVFGGGGVFPDIIVKDSQSFNTIRSTLLDITLLERYGEKLVGFSSQKQLCGFVRKQLEGLDDKDLLFSVCSQLITSYFGDVAGLKFENKEDKCYRKAVSVLSSSLLYNKILNVKK